MDRSDQWVREGCRPNSPLLGTDTGVLCKRVRSVETKDGIMAESSTENQPTRG
jgi:hypothetical protein